MGLIQEFKEFLQEYKVVGVAVAFIMAAATTALVQSLVNNIIMPLLSPLMPGGDWQAAALVAGPFKIGWGPFLAALVNFLIIALVVFAIAKMVLKEEKAAKK
jgi:large conductance mechanosensitive channel